MKILFITLSNIGDAVMTTPTLERLHQLYPDAVIDLVCDPRSQILFTHCPYRGEIILKQKKQGKRGLLKLIAELRKTRYDLIVDLRTDGLSFLLKADRRLTKWGHQAYGPHAVEDLISIIDKINPQRIIPSTKIWISTGQESRAAELTRTLPGKSWLALGPGANWEPKTWQPENFAHTANSLKNVIDAVILLGGTGDTGKSQQVADLLEIPFIDLTAKTDLLTSSAVMQRCALFIGNDSGLGHLAGAMNVSTVSVFGPGNPQRYHPWHPSNRWIVGNDNRLEQLPVKQVTETALSLMTDGQNQHEHG